LESNAKSKVNTAVEREMDMKEIFGNIRRCTKCILPETFPGIEFDEDGVCNYCWAYISMRAQQSRTGRDLMQPSIWFSLFFVGITIEKKALSQTHDPAFCCLKAL
jgi:uncharacterized paraquat-inducible protein A